MLRERGRYVATAVALAACVAHAQPATSPYEQEPPRPRAIAPLPPPLPPPPSGIRNAKPSRDAKPSDVAPGRVGGPRDPVGPKSSCLSPCLDLTWTILTPPTPGLEGAAASIIGPTIFVSHGYSGGDLTILRFYDIPTDTWSAGPSASVIRSELGGAAIGATHYAVGGRTGPNAELEAYDTGSGTWSALTPMPTPRGGLAVVVLNGLIHVIGGRNDAAAPNQSVTPLAVHEVYDPATNALTTRAPLLNALADEQAAVAIGSRIFVFGGWVGGTVSGLTQIYDDATDSWTLGAPMPTPRSNAAAGVLSGHAIVIGGLDRSSQNLRAVEVYDPATNSWCVGPDKPTRTSEMASGALSTPNAIYCIGSGPSGIAQGVNEALVMAPSASCCPVSITGPPTDQATCVGGAVTLDASGISLPTCTGTLNTTWFDAGGGIVATTPVASVSPLGTTTYSVHVECSSDPACFYDATVTVTVEVPPTMANVVARDPTPCNLALELTWSPAVFFGPGLTGVYNIYRSETSCADALSRPPIVTGLTISRWVDYLTQDGHSYDYVVEAEDSSASGPCVPRGPNNGGAVVRQCAASVTESSTTTVPDGVYAALRARHVGDDVTLYWSGSRPLLSDEHYHLLKAWDVPWGTFSHVNGEASVATSWTENDVTSNRQFFDARVADACEQVSAAEYPPGYDTP